MPAKSEKQKNFFGAVMGAKKGQPGSSPKAKKVAKDMPKKEIKKFLKSEDEEDESTDEAKRCEDEARCEVYGEPIKKKRKWVNSQLLDDEEDEQSISKQMKNTGKATIKGPQVKERKKFAPPTKVESPKKGKGSYNRKETFDENTDIVKFIDCILTKNYTSANKYIKQAVESKLQKRIEQELSTPLF